MRRPGHPVATRVRAGAAVLAGLVMATGAVMLAPGASAMPYGNYNVAIPDRYDFHTWIWMVSPCGDGCVLVGSRAQPVARAYPFNEQAHLSDGRYTLVIDDPYGLRCGNVYYGPTVATHDVYTWDAATLAGSLQSSFDAGCDGAPGTLTYPITLTRM
jgi:hypothetical protein